MKKLTYLMMIAFMAFSFYSCKEELIIDSSLDVEFLESIPNEGGSRDLKFKASGDWEININETKTTEWLTVIPMSGGKGDVVAKITADKNPNHDGREATIIISIGGKSQEITVIQKQVDEFSFTGVPTEPIPLEGGRFEITVSENIGTPTVEIGKDAEAWIDLTETKTLDQTVLRFKVLENTTIDERLGTITIKSDDKSETFTVTQKGIAVWVTVSKATVELDSSEGAYTTVDIESNTSWSVSSDEEWCTIFPKKGSNNQTITIHATKNTILRTATVTVSVSEEIKKTIAVTQTETMPIRLGTLLISDRNLGTQVPQSGIALNYSNDPTYQDNANVLFKGDYYTFSEAQTACPAGWRLPTFDELGSIVGAMRTTGKRSYLEDEKGNRCYFPLSGNSAEPSKVSGTYWSSSDDTSNAWALLLFPGGRNTGTINSRIGCSVRCVKTVG